MKLLKYYLATQINHGTEEEPKLETVLSAWEQSTNEASYASDLAAAKAHAYNGEVTVEIVPDVPTPPTAQELAAENKLLHQQVVALTDRGDFQEELIVELANIVYA